MERQSLPCQFLSNIWSSGLGIMFRQNLTGAVRFQTSLGIHTLFVRFPIDVLLCDKAGNIVMTYQSLKPWRILVWGIKTYMVIELPQGTIDQYHITPASKVTYSQTDLVLA